MDVSQPSLIGRYARNGGGIVAPGIKERPTTINEASSPDERRSQKQRELVIAREFAAETKDRNERRRRWIDRTGKSEPTLYRRLAELRKQ